MAQLRRVIALSIALISPLLLVLIGSGVMLRISTSTALAGPEDNPALINQASLEFSAGYHQVAYRGDTISFTHFMTNTGIETDSFAIMATSPTSWPIDLSKDSLAAGSPFLSITLSAEMTATLYVSLTVPTDTAILSGTIVPIAITATSQLSPTVFASTIDTITVYAATSGISYSLYLPSLAKNSGVRFVQLGADFGPSLLLSDTSVLTTDLAIARNLGTTWTRAWLPWALIETAPGQYDWSWADQQINQFAQAGYKINAVFYYPPTWAAGTGCGPITNTAALEQFLTVLVTRYKDQVDAWEFINEPDSPNGYPRYGPVIGCWSLQAQMYVDRLALFHARIKALDPSALVILGGLAYDNWSVFDRDFITHTLQSGSGPYFDVVSLHFYPTNPQDFPTMADKINDIMAILQRHNVYQKLIWITEASMWTNSPGGSLEAQKNFIVQEQTRGFCAGADKIFWYAIREELAPLKRWLINRQHKPDQGHVTYQHYASRLQGAFCRERYTETPANVEGYEFGTPTGQLYILWTTSGTANVALPARSTATLVTRDGQSEQPVTPVGGIVTVAVDQMPVFVIANE